MLTCPLTSHSFCQSYIQRRAEKKESNTTSQKLKTIEESSPPIKKKPAMLKASSLQPNMGNVLAELQQKGLTKKSTPPRISDFPDDESNDVSGEKSGRKNIIDEQQQLENERIEKDRLDLEQQARVNEEKERHERERLAMEQQARIFKEEQLRLEKERHEHYAMEQQAREAAVASAAAKRQAQEEQLQTERLQNERYAIQENAIEVEFDSSNVSSIPQVSPRETRQETRREIMNRRRRRMNSTAASATPPSRVEKTNPETVTQVSADQQSSNPSARAAARDRYARHKRMKAQQQRHTANANANKNDGDNRTFSC